MEAGPDSALSLHATLERGNGLLISRFELESINSVTVVRAMGSNFVTSRGLHPTTLADHLRQSLETTLDLLENALGPGRQLTPSGSKWKVTFDEPRRAGSSASPGSRYGGQPAWIGEPTWPVSSSSGELMRFLFQIELPAPLRWGGHRMAYAFMSTEFGDDGSHSCEAEGGENAVILQGGPAFLPLGITTAVERGPHLVQGHRPEYSTVHDYDPDSPAVEGSITIEPHLPGDEFPEFSMLGGTPDWLQNDDTPPDGPWSLLMQIEREHVPCWVPFDGWAYIFVRPDGHEARLLYQTT